MIDAKEARSLRTHRTALDRVMLEIGTKIRIRAETEGSMTEVIHSDFSTQVAERLRDLGFFAYVHTERSMEPWRSVLISWEEQCSR